MKRYELHFFDRTLTKPGWVYWKKYKTEKGAFDATKTLLQGLFSDCDLAKIRDSFTGDESLFSVANS